MEKKIALASGGSNNSGINNSIYDELGDSWYTATDDPVALLRAESRLLGPWVQSEIEKHFGSNRKIKILDMGCGAGFLSNTLATHNHQVTGIDQSASSLAIAQKFDLTHTVYYTRADAHHLPKEIGTFDAVCCMDFLEHVSDPERIISEVKRVLNAGGLFFFHTFNRNILSYWIAIRLVEFALKKTPKNLHVLELFIKPIELNKMCESQGLSVTTWKGLRPQFVSLSFLKSLFQRRVGNDFSFKFSRSLAISYAGMAKHTAKPMMEV